MSIKRVHPCGESRKTERRGGRGGRDDGADSERAVHVLARCAAVFASISDLIAAAAAAAAGVREDGRTLHRNSCIPG